MKYLLAIFIFSAYCADVGDDWGQVSQAVEKIKSNDKKSTNPSTPPRQKQALKRERGEQIDKIESIADKHSTDPSAQTKIARAFLDVSEPGRALKRADQAVNLAPQDPFARLIHGQASYQLGRFDQAASDAKTALRFSPNNPQALALLKLSSGRSGVGGAGGQERPTSAQPSVPAAVKSYAGQAEAKTTADRIKADTLIKQATGKMSLSDYNPAKTFLNRAIAFDGQNAAAYKLRAIVSQALHDGPGALSDSSRALQINPQDAEARVIRAQASELMRLSAATILADYKAASELDGRFVHDYQQALARHKDDKPSRPPERDAEPKARLNWQRVMRDLSQKADVAAPAAAVILFVLCLGVLVSVLRGRRGS